MRTLSSNELTLVSGGLFTPTQIQASLDLISIFAGIGSMIKQDVTDVKGQITALKTGKAPLSSLPATFTGDLKTGVTQFQAVLSLVPRVGSDLKTVFA